MSAPRRVLVVDDHPVVRRGVRDLLEATDRYTVVGEAGTAAAAERLCAETEPEVVVLDLRLPDLPGDQLTARLRVLRPEVRVLVVTLHASPTTAARCLEAGALGMVSKEAEPDDLLRAVDAVAAGQQLLGPGLAGDPGGAAQRTRLDALTPREREVAAALARGLTNPQIAAELHLSPKTVRNVVSNVLMRLDVDNRTAAALVYDEETRDASRDG